jgi:type II secretory pathway pseudopilin PulG
MSKKRCKGQSLFELVVAVGLVGIVLLALTGLASKSISNAIFSRNRSLASRFNQETLEWVRGTRDAGWDNFVNNYVKSPSGGNETTWCLPSLNFNLRRSCGDGDKIANTSFLREATLTYVSSTPPSVNLLVVVKWSDSTGYHDSRATTIFTNWRAD